MSFALKDWVMCRLEFDSTSGAVETATDAFEGKLASDGNATFPGIPFNTSNLRARLIVQTDHEHGCAAQIFDACPASV